MQEMQVEKARDAERMKLENMKALEYVKEKIVCCMHVHAREAFSMMHSMHAAPGGGIASRYGEAEGGEGARDC